MLTRTPVRRRSGTASVEAALVLNLVVVPLMIGVWEMGRVIHAQQVVSNAAREGARYAAQGRIITEASGAIEITTANVTDTVYQAVVTGGLSGLARSDVTITFEFIPPTGGWVGPPPTEPFNAKKLDQFRVHVSVPFDKVRWVNLGLVNPTSVAYTVDWFMLVDDQFNVNETLPTW